MFRNSTFLRYYLSGNTINCCLLRLFFPQWQNIVLTLCYGWQCSPSSLQVDYENQISTWAACEISKWENYLMNYHEKKSKGLNSKSTLNYQDGYFCLLVSDEWLKKASSLITGLGGGEGGCRERESSSNCVSPTSPCPLKAAWCNAVLPARSDTFTLLRRGTKASAHFTALLAAAMCNGVCQFLSRALTSAECFKSTWTAS